MSVRRCAMLLLLGVLPATASRAAAQAVTHAPQVRYAEVNGVRLQYVDWGGPPGATGLVFLAGLGDSPRAYDEIAPRFAGHYRVIAIARRGHGGSEARPPFDVPTMSADLDGLLDHLGIRRVVLAGWSMGGDEAADYAVRHPSRVAAIVFLDSYDLSSPAYAAMLSHYPVSYDPDPSALTSAAAFRRWWKRTSAPDVPWSPAMRAEVNDLFTVRADGSVRAKVTDSLEAAFITGLMAFHPEYARITAPVLAFQARPDPRTQADPALPDSLRRKVDRWVVNELLPWQDSAHARFRRALPAAHVVFLDRTRHSALPFQARERIVREMTRFLAGLPDSAGRAGSGPS